MNEYNLFLSKKKIENDNYFGMNYFLKCDIIMKQN